MKLVSIMLLTGLFSIVLINITSTSSKKLDVLKKFDLFDSEFEIASVITNNIDCAKTLQHTSSCAIGQQIPTWLLGIDEELTSSANSKSYFLNGKSDDAGSSKDFKIIARCSETKSGSSDHERAIDFYTQDLLPYGKESYLTTAWCIDCVQQNIDFEAWGEENVPSVDSEKVLPPSTYWKSKWGEHGVAMFGELDLTLVKKNLAKGIRVAGTSYTGNDSVKDIAMDIFRSVISGAVSNIDDISIYFEPVTVHKGHNTALGDSKGKKYNAGYSLGPGAVYSCRSGEWWYLFKNILEYPENGRYFAKMVTKGSNSNFFILYKNSMFYNSAFDIIDLTVEEYLEVNAYNLPLQDGLLAKNLKAMHYNKYNKNWKTVNVKPHTEPGDCQVKKIELKPVDPENSSAPYNLIVVNGNKSGTAIQVGFDNFTPSRQCVN